MQSILVGVEYTAGDLAKPETFKKALEKVDMVFHLASSVVPKSSNDDVIADVSVNLIGSLHLLEQARLAGIKKLIFVSSGGAVYGIPESLPIAETHPTQPLSSYGIVKLAIEKYLYLYQRLYGLDYCVLRVSNVYGNMAPANRDFGAIDNFVQKAKNNESIEIWGDGSIIRDYIHVDDVVEALLLVMTYSGPEKIFNIGSGTGVSLNELITLIEAELNQKVSVNYLSGRSVDVPANILDISLVQKTLRWTPKIKLKQGIRFLLDRGYV